MTAVSDPHQIRIDARNRSPKARWEAANPAEDQETRIGVGGMRWRLSVRGWRVRLELAPRHSFYNVPGRAARVGPGAENTVGGVWVPPKEPRVTRPGAIPSMFVDTRTGMRYTVTWFGAIGATMPAAHRTSTVATPTMSTWSTTTSIWQEAAAWR